MASDLMDSLTQCTHEWISVKDRLPENKQEVLVYDDDFMEMMVCRYEDDQWNYYFMLKNTSLQIMKVTHWMYLPELPSGV